MEAEEEEVPNNSTEATVKPPDVAEGPGDAQPDLGMTDAQCQLDAPPHSEEPPSLEELQGASAAEHAESQLLPVAEETIQDEAGKVAAEENEAVASEAVPAAVEQLESVTDSSVVVAEKEDERAGYNVAEEGDQSLPRVQSPPRGAGGDGGDVDLGEASEAAAVREFEVSEVEKLAEAADDTVSQPAAGVLEEMKEVGAVEDAEEVVVTAVTDAPAVDSQVYEEEHAPAGQGVTDVPEKGLESADVVGETMDYREPGNDDMVRLEADSAEAMETERGNVEVAEVLEVEAEIEGMRGDDAGDETAATDAAVVDDMTVGGGDASAEEVGVDPREDANEMELTEAAEEAGVDNREDDNEAEMVEANEELELEDTDAAEETDGAEEMEKVDELSKGVAGQKRKRGRAPKAMTKVTPKKKIEEDVCFICFDGGDLVLCDRRGCPKAYHPSCVNRDEAFFRTKGRWNCGWHLCSSCEKNAYYMCYTCTFSLCKSCIKDSVIFCVRGNKGFCESCMRTITLIEDNLKGDKEMDQVDFDDKNSWEYLFKDYYIDLKEKLSLGSEELSRAKNPWKGSEGPAGKQESPDEDYDVNNDRRSDSENSSGHPEGTVPKRRQGKRRLKAHTKGRDLPNKPAAVSPRKASIGDDAQWASKELLEFVMHMKNGEKTVLSQYDVQALLLEYIQRNKLRDPKRKSQILCDPRLQNLFGKSRVGHFEMLKLLESHYLIKEDADDLQGTVVDTDVNQLEVDGNSDVSMKGSKDRKRKMRKKGDERTPQFNLDDYAAIDTHNINLIYVRRNLLEDLIEDTEAFHDKVVGSFVRIRISGSNQKQDLYRLVPVVGTSKTGEQYKVGKRMTNFLLEILNLNKTEVISIDIISNQEFTEDECKRLRQSIKCGLINRLTVGDIYEKAVALQAVRVKDWLETETLRLSHLRDRASDLGRRKELRECVEKLQLLKTPEERQRRLEEVPEIHADPKMDPSYESEDDEVEADDKRQENYVGSRSSGFTGRGREPISPQVGGSASYDSWSGSGARGQTREFTRNISGKGLLNDTGGAVEHESSWSQVRERESHQVGGRERANVSLTSEIGARSSNSSGIMPESANRSISETQAASLAIATPLQPTVKVNESEKIWHYQDPSGKIQGPFSMAQLRKWNNTGYFPADLRIWKAAEKQDESILLADALNGKFQKDLSHAPHPQGVAEIKVAERSTLVGRTAPSSVEVPKYGGGDWNAGTNLPSPTPGGAAGGKGQPDQQRRTPAGSAVSANLFTAGNGGMHAAQPSSSVPFVSATQVHSQAPDLGNVSANTSAEVKITSLNLQSLVQAVRNQNPPVETRGWGSAPISKVAEMVAPSHKSEPVPLPVQQQPQAQVQWSGGGAAPAASSAANFASYGSGFANQWRPPGSGDQPSMQTPAPQAMNWGYANPNNFVAPPPPPPCVTAPETQNTGWVQMPGNPATGWGNPNPGWSGQGQVQAPVQAPANPIPAWAPPRNVTPGPGYVAPGQGQAPSMNVNPSWPAPANQGTWLGDQNPNQNGDGFQGQRSRGSGGESGYGGGNKPWNGRGGGGHSRTATGICKWFYENGHCKKGASCNYRHN